MTRPAYTRAHVPSLADLVWLYTVHAWIGALS